MATANAIFCDLDNIPTYLELVRYILCNIGPCWPLSKPSWSIIGTCWDDHEATFISCASRAIFNASWYQELRKQLHQPRTTLCPAPRRFQQIWVPFWNLAYVCSFATFIWRLDCKTFEYLGHLRLLCLTEAARQAQDEPYKKNRHNPNLYCEKHLHFNSFWKHSYNCNNEMNPTRPPTPRKITTSNSNGKQKN